MGDLSEHFNKREFACKCGKVHEYEMNPELITRLEKLHDLLNASAIYISSGYRCPEHSKNVGGYFNDAHTKSIAADITATDASGKTYDSDTIAEAAEICGFNGIGIISKTAVHVDVRNTNNYVNGHWFGDERTGNDNIATFIRGTVFHPRTETKTETKQKTHIIKMYIDDTLVYESEVK